MDIAAIAALAPVIPVLTIERPADAVPLARALVKGGLPVLEITLRTATAMAALEAIARRGAGGGGRGRDGPGSCPGRAEFRGWEQSSPSARAARPALSPQPGRPACRSCPVCKRCRRRWSWPSRDTGPEVLPGRCRGRTGLAEGRRRAFGRPALLPDRRHRRRYRPGLPVAAQRRLRRRLVGGAAPGVGCPGLDADRAAGRRSVANYKRL